MPAPSCTRHPGAGFNARVTRAEARLRAAGQARAEAERVRRAGRHARLTEAIVAAWAAPHRPGDPAWARWAHDAGLGEIVGVPVAGQEVFAVEPTTWQVVLLQLCMTGAGKRRFEADQVLQGLRERGVLKAPFATARAWDSDLVEQVRARLPDFQPPVEVVSAYCAHLVGCGVLRPGAGGWRADPDTAGSMQSCGVVALGHQLRHQLTPVPRARNPLDHASTPQLCMLPDRQGRAPWSGADDGSGHHAAHRDEPRDRQVDLPAPPPPRSSRPVSSRPGPSFSGLGRDHRRRRFSVATSTPPSSHASATSVQQVDGALATVTIGTRSHAQ